jgi:hypothetical protein
MAPSTVLVSCKHAASHHDVVDGVCGTGFVLPKVVWTSLAEPPDEVTEGFNIRGVLSVISYVLQSMSSTALPHVL